MLVLDSGAVTFFARRTAPSDRLLRDLKGEWGLPQVPSMVLVECLTGRPDDAHVHRLLKACRVIEHVPRRVALNAAVLRRLAQQGSAVDALVTCLAQGGAVVTGDRGDISALATHAVDVLVVGI